MSDADFDPIPADGLLVALAEVARHKEGFELGITVNVPGATVTGIMIGPRAWLRILGASGEGGAHDFLNWVRENEFARAKKRSAIHWAGLSFAVIALGLHQPTHQQQELRRSAR